MLHAMPLVAATSLAIIAATILLGVIFLAYRRRKLGRMGALVLALIVVLLSAIVFIHPPAVVPD